MAVIWEKQFWCDDCKRTHVIKVYSPSELSDDDKAAFFAEGEYCDQLRRHTVCGNCGRNVIPHTDLTVVSLKGEWKDICPECARNPRGVS
jgi:hypothetical protein